MTDTIYLHPSPSGPGQIIHIDSSLCQGCNACVNVCRRHILLPNMEKGKPPVIQSTSDCWLDGYCVLYCPVPNAIKMVHPLAQRVGWKRKATGEYFRVGMLNPPLSNNKPPVGGRNTQS